MRHDLSRGADHTSHEYPIGQAFLQRTPRRLDGIDLDINGIDNGAGAGPSLRTTDTVAGVLVALRDNGTQPFSDEQLDMMAAFVDEAALAWQLATSQRRMREVDVLTDRDRIPRDLHDHVIQRLFAVGLALQGTVPRARSTEVQQRLSDSVDDLQGVIQDPTTFFDLHGAPRGNYRLRQRLDEAIAKFSGSDLRTTVQFTGPFRWSMLHWPPRRMIPLRLVRQEDHSRREHNHTHHKPAKPFHTSRFTIRSNGIFPPEFVLP